ncbi:hypothetical protein HY041_03455 [Candidatus Roizmanbacteria bacterium]|nr:hypothetical protein [Candidatus Roizmanbacteria bacterium]
MKLALLCILFFAIVPNLGFFTFLSFMAVTVVFLLLIFSRKLDNTVNPFFLIVLILYGIVYYGGLYQNTNSIFIGRFLSVLILIISLIRSVIKKTTLMINPFIIFVIISILYIFLSSWTLYNSPFPHVDTFFQFLEAPQKILVGQNPYHAQYTKVYATVKPDYFPYLPFSIIYTFPFVVLFSDPRYGIIFANIISAYCIYRLFQSKHKDQIGLLYITAFLLLPRSFYIIEHMYLDSIIYMFFVLFIYWRVKKNYSLSVFFVSLFFSFKQHLFFLLPLLFQKKHINTLLFFAPFLLALYFFLIDPQGFIKNIIFYFNPHTIPAPVSMSLSLTTLLRNIPILSTTNYIYVIPVILFFFMYLSIVQSSRTFVSKVTISVFAFTYLMYQSFYNHYYLVSLFLFLDILLEYLTIKV